MICGGLLASVALTVNSFIMGERVLIGEALNGLVRITSNSKFEHLYSISTLIFSFTISCMIIFSILDIVKQRKELKREK